MPRKPRTEPCEGAGPDWRIVTNGKRYRVQRRTKRHSAYYTGNDVWEDVTDQYIGSECFIPLPPLPNESVEYGKSRLGLRPFETRFLWRARRRLRREIKQAKPEPAWRPVL
jgi:hypothetical protein